MTLVHIAKIMMQPMPTMELSPHIPKEVKKKKMVLIFFLPNSATPTLGTDHAIGPHRKD